MAFYPGERFGRIEERQFVLADALDVLDAQGEMIHRLEAELLLERIEHVGDGRGRVVLERLGLPVLQVDFHDVGHQRGARLFLAQRLTLPMTFVEN